MKKKSLSLEMFPGCAVVAYINTTAELKTVCDVCVTSSSAVKIVSNMPQDKILFIPDCNLGQYVKSQVPNKDIRYMQGGCPVHEYRIGLPAGIRFRHQ